MLFRGWNRLCSHAASQSAVEAAATTPTAAAMVARADKEPTDITVTRQRAEAAERDAREHAHRADEMEKRAAAAAEQVKVLENIAKISVRAVEEKKRQHAVRLVSVDAWLPRRISVEPACVERPRKLRIVRVVRHLCRSFNKLPNNAAFSSDANR